MAVTDKQFAAYKRDQERRAREWVKEGPDIPTDADIRSRKAATEERERLVAEGENPPSRVDPRWDTKLSEEEVANLEAGRGPDPKDDPSWYVNDQPTEKERAATDMALKASAEIDEVVNEPPV